SILFLNVTGEEKGLLGSEYYSDSPVFPLANTVTNINIDMVGRIDYEYEKEENKDYVYVIGSEMLSSHLKKINEYNNITYTNLVLDYRYDAADDPNRFYYRSDHYNFAKHNIPVIFFFNGVHDDYHQVTDTVDKIEFPLMTKRAQLIFHTSWDLANREYRTPVDGTNTRTDREEQRPRHSGPSYLFSFILLILSLQLISIRLFALLLGFDFLSFSDIDLGLSFLFVKSTLIIRIFTLLEAVQLPSVLLFFLERSWRHIYAFRDGQLLHRHTDHIFDPLKM